MTYVVSNLRKVGFNQLRRTRPCGFLCKMSSTVSEMPGSEGLDQLILELFEVEAVKFGTFTLKSGIESPVYFDLRVIVSYPELMVKVADALYEAVKAKDCEYASVCGVPYTALPIATCISTKHNIPMLIRRKEAKGYGTKKMIEGKFSAGDLCLIIEDVVTSGSSVLETVQSLTSEGLAVKDAVVLLNREQGGSETLKDRGINLHSVITISKLLGVLQREGKINDEVVKSVQKFIEDNNTRQADGNQGNGNVNNTASEEKPKVLSYHERADACTHPLTKRLFTIMAYKKTNLALSADVTSAHQILQLADKLGPYICVLKTHVDIVEDFSDDFITKLANLAARHNFLIFEDRKFADIGKTVNQQYSRGIYKIANWAHIINAHVLPGPGVIDGLKEIGKPREQGCLLIAEMSSKGNLCKDEYTQAAIQMAKEHSDYVVGFICQHKLTKDDPSFVHMTPGVQMQSGGGDSLGQQYLSPSEVIGRRGSDIIIVGRGILQAPDPVLAAKQFQAAGYNAYEALLQGGTE